SRLRASTALFSSATAGTRSGRASRHWWKRAALLSLLSVCVLGGTDSLSGVELSLPSTTNVPPLTTAQQVLDFGLEGPRRSCVPVRLQGLVTYPEPNVHMIYVQDNSAGIRVIYTNANYLPASGQMVVVEGTAAAGMFAPFVDQSNVRVVGTSPI